jgi:phosphoheptose isomerase
LAEDILLGDDFLRQLMSVGEVDLLVAIPTYNNASTVVQAVQAIDRKSTRLNSSHEQ